MKIQLARMHKQFGRNYAHTCGTCCNFVRHEHQHVYFKCLRYGMSACTASDWAKSWGACRKHNVPLAKGERPLKEYVDRRKAPEVVEGQISMLENESARRNYDGEHQD